MCVLFPTGEPGLIHPRADAGQPGQRDCVLLRSGTESHLRPDGAGFLPPLPPLPALHGADQSEQTRLHARPILSLSSHRPQAKTVQPSLSATSSGWDYRDVYVWQQAWRLTYESSGLQADLRQYCCLYCCCCQSVFTPLCPHVAWSASR